MASSRKKRSRAVVTLLLCLAAVCIVAALEVLSCLGLVLSLGGIGGLRAVGLPEVEPALCLLLCESAFPDAATEVLHEHHALAGEDAAYSVGGDCAYFHPIQSTVEV